MTRRRFLALFAATMLGLAGLSLTPARADIRVRIHGVACTCRVYYFDRAANALVLFGTYNSDIEASKVATHLQHQGYRVRFEASSDPLPQPVVPRVPVAQNSDEVTPQVARKAFAQMAAQNDIAFQFPADGCYARAHLMARRMQSMGLRPRKVWSFAHGESLYARTSHIPAGFVEWGYHVAPTLRVKTDNGVHEMVIDPSLFDRPVTVGQWSNAQRRSGASPMPYTCVTRLGESPVLPTGRRAPGTGFWPASDPSSNLDTFAARVMAIYKPWQNHTPPKNLLASALAAR
jgi:hypothetical protein